MLLRNYVDCGVPYIRYFFSCEEDTFDLILRRTKPSTIGDIINVCLLLRISKIFLGVTIYDGDPVLSVGDSVDQVETRAKYFEINNDIWLNKVTD